MPKGTLLTPTTAASIVGTYELRRKSDGRLEGCIASEDIIRMLASSIVEAVTAPDGRIKYLRRVDAAPSKPSSPPPFPRQKPREETYLSNSTGFAQTGIGVYRERLPVAEVGCVHVDFRVVTNESSEVGGFTYSFRKKPGALAR